MNGIFSYSPLLSIRSNDLFQFKFYFLLFLFFYCCSWCFFVFKTYNYYELAGTGDPDAALLDDNDDDVGEDADEVPITDAFSCAALLITKFSICNKGKRDCDLKRFQKYFFQYK